MSKKIEIICRGTIEGISEGVASSWLGTCSVCGWRILIGLNGDIECGPVCQTPAEEVYDV